ncbi:hypothetical protein RSAG8_10508, partial [Rhizoctonia solani AG-8 WAC10335]
MSSVILPILHFNDVYNMASIVDVETKNDEVKSSFKIMENGKLTRTNFDVVARFSEKINEIRNDWPDLQRESGEEEVERGLLLFSGDLFSPSVESMLTKGRNMVHLMNELAPDACVPGKNWILSNVKEYPLKQSPQDKNVKVVNFESEGNILGGLREYCVFKRSGLVIGVIGLMSKNAMDGTLSVAKENLGVDKADLDEADPDKADSGNMKRTCLRLSKKLRDPKDKGGEGCDIVLALTHASHEEDVTLGRYVNAYPSTHKDGLEDMEGVDAILGGHIHEYFLGHGVQPENGSEIPGSNKPQEGDNGLLIVKSNYDFKDLTELKFELVKQPEGKRRKYVVRSLKATRHRIENNKNKDVNLKQSRMWKVLHRQFQNEVLRGLLVPVAHASGLLKFDSEDPRKFETPIGNWITDMLLEAYNEMGMDESQPPLVPTIFIMTGGSIRSNGLPEDCQARDIIALLPFKSTLVALQLTGHAIYDALEGALSLSGTGDQAPQKPETGEDAGTDTNFTSSGQFPVFSGIHVEWDSTKPKNSRVLKVTVPGKGGSRREPIDPAKDYIVLTNDYLAAGNIGFQSFQSASKRSNCDIPMFQAMLSYIRLLGVANIGEQIVQWIYATSSSNIQDSEEKFESLLALLSQMDLEQKTSKLDTVKKQELLQRAAKLFTPDAPNSYIPFIEIKPVDGRMIDVSKRKAE